MDDVPRRSGSGHDGGLRHGRLECRARRPVPTGERKVRPGRGATPDAELRPGGPLGRVCPKNSRQLAGYAGHNDPYGLQHLLSRSKWGPDELRDDVQEFVAQRLGAPDNVLP